MKLFDSENIRNIALVGHGDSGKTSLASALLYSAGAVNRLARVEEGNTTTDFDEDEIERNFTINTALAYMEWNGTKINVLDTPGYRTFILDAKASMVGAETAVVVVDAVSGVEVQTELVWSYAEEFKLARVFVVNKLDRDRASFDRTLESLHTAFGRAVLPVQLPIGEEQDFRGIVDLIRGKAYLYENNPSGNFKEEAIPDELQDGAQQRREELIEMIAENDDELMEKFFESGTLSDEELLAGLRMAVQKQEVFPVFCVSSTHNIGIKQLLNWIVELFPNPLERGSVTVIDSKTEEEKEFQIGKDGIAAGYVLKTLADPFAGRINLIKVISGNLKSDSTLRNFTREANERLGTLQLMQGKAHEGVTEARTGDICAVLKLKETNTGDTLAERSFEGAFKRVEFPEPSISFAIEPKSRGDEDKLSHAIARLLAEDPSLRFGRDSRTREFLLSGSGQLHVEVAVGKLKRKFGVEVVLKTPKVAYRETITGTADVQGKHKKQTGGHGQYGDCKIKMEPLERDGGFEFVNEIFGGSIPRNYIPAVEKGITEAAGKGFLAGYPVVDFKVILYDGSYHEVDSSDMAFKIAASLAFKKAVEQAKPVLLEPIMNVEVYAPEENAGDVIGDLNGRRGRILGMDVKRGTQVIGAQVPMAEMLNYAPTLTSLTGGRGSFHMDQSHYDIVPSQLTERIIEEARREKEEKRA
ncbi:elongation factor G [Acidobacteria bacterium AH-259-D05]|nr:elongation factor G [Acidobacteria bacterium AH-259-D05]